MKCLEKDRRRRYETASELALDLNRHLNNEPVLARPPSRAYLLRKLIRRNRGVFLSALLLFLVLLGGTIGTTLGMIKAEQARRDAVSAKIVEAQRAEGETRAKEEAQRRLAQIEKGTEILASVFEVLDPIAAEKAEVTSRVLLWQRMDALAQQLEGDTVGDPLVVARLQHLLGVSSRELENSLGGRHLARLEQAEGLLVKACRTRERLLGVDHLDTVATKHELAQVYGQQGKYPLSETLFKQVLAIRTAELGADHLDTLATKHQLAWVYKFQKKYALAETLCNEVVAKRTAELGGDNLDTLATKHLLANLWRLQGKFSLAEALFTEVVAGRSARLGRTIPTASIAGTVWR